MKGPVHIFAGQRLVDAERALRTAGFKPRRLLPNIRNWSRKVGTKGSVYEDYRFWVNEDTNRVYTARHARIYYGVVDLKKLATKRSTGK